MRLGLRANLGQFHRDHEDRPGRLGPTWAGDGPERGRRVRRGGCHRPGHGYLASAYGLRPAPFLLGAAYIALGLGLSAARVRETRDHARHEAASRVTVSGQPAEHLTTGLVALGATFTTWAAAAVLLGAGTAMVYPTLLAVIGDVAHPAWRARSVGVYRLWRDGGFVVGALLAGGIADAFGLLDAIWVIAALTAAAGILVASRMHETRPGGPAEPRRSSSSRATPLI